MTTEVLNILYFVQSNGNVGYKATGNKNVDWCPVNYKDGTKRAQDGEWQKGW